MFKLVKKENFITLFVNSKNKPNKIIPFDIYQYKDNESVWRLCKLVYIQDESIEHSLLDWVEYPIKPFTSQNISLISEAMKGIKEFILEK